MLTEERDPITGISILKFIDWNIGVDAINCLFTINGNMKMAYFPYHLSLNTN